MVMRQLRRIAPAAMIVAASFFPLAANAVTLNTSTWSFNGGPLQTTGGEPTGEATIGDTVRFHDVLGDGKVDWVIGVVKQVSGWVGKYDDIAVNSAFGAAVSAPYSYRLGVRGNTNLTYATLHSSFVDSTTGELVELQDVRFTLTDIDSNLGQNFTDWVSSSNGDFSLVTGADSALEVIDDTLTGYGGSLVRAKQVNGSWGSVPNITDDSNYDAYLSFASLSETYISFGVSGVTSGGRGGGIAAAAAFEPTVTPSPVPVPAAAPLLIAGLGAIGFAARRRKSA